VCLYKRLSAFQKPKAALHVQELFFVYASLPRFKSEFRELKLDE